ncbi:MAG: phosphotransferase [candidate division KSB1 bacterium]|nr:phosphotransferase [candidate division KSB1 bacterium]
MTAANEIAVTDRKLPGLACALNDEEMRRLLASALPHSFKGGGNLRVHHQILKHAPGKRCVIEYSLEADGKAPLRRRVIGKIYRKDRGRIIFENLRQLWEAAAAAGISFGMAEPLACLPEIGMVLQSRVPGRRLADFGMNEDLSVAVRAVAENLAALHGLAVSTSEKRGLDDHLRKYCHPGPEVLMASCPESAPLVERLLAGLAKDGTLQDAPICPVHGDLNLAQIFIAEARAWFIDFDGFCLSHPALDLGNFLVTLQVYFGPDHERLAKQFLENYLKSRSHQMLTGLRAYQAFAYLRRAVICARAPAGPDWRQQVRQLLETGNILLA